jgi:hypothetical protein
MEAEFCHIAMNFLSKIAENFCKSQRNSIVSSLIVVAEKGKLFESKGVKRQTT